MPGAKFVPNHAGLDSLKDSIASAHQEAVQGVYETAYNLCPKRTGRLANSIRVENTSEGLSTTLSANTPYADIVEAKTPFLAPAMNRYEQLFMEALARAY